MFVAVCVASVSSNTTDSVCSTGAFISASLFSGHYNKPLEWHLYKCSRGYSVIDTLFSNKHFSGSRGGHIRVALLVLFYLVSSNSDSTT